MFQENLRGYKKEGQSPRCGSNFSGNSCILIILIFNMYDPSLSMHWNRNRDTDSGRWSRVNGKMESIKGRQPNLIHWKCEAHLVKCIIWLLASTFSCWNTPYEQIEFWTLATLQQVQRCSQIIHKYPIRISSFQPYCKDTCIFRSLTV